MSVYNIKSKAIANRDASPSVLSNPEVLKGYLKAVVGVERTSAAGVSLGAAGTTIRLLSVPSNARLHSLEYACGDIETSSLNITVFYPTSIPQGGANSVAASSAGNGVASSLFATSITGVDGGNSWTNGFAAASPGVNTMAEPLWKVLGLSTDPGINFDFGFSVVTAVTTNGYVGLRATYVD